MCRPAGPRRVGAAIGLSLCRKRCTTKDSGSTPVNTVFGQVEVLESTLEPVRLPTEGPEDIPPNERWLRREPAQNSSIWRQSGLPCCPLQSADLLKEVLPVGDLMNARRPSETTCSHAERIERELGEERQMNLLEGSEEEWEKLPSAGWADHSGYRWGYVGRPISRGSFEVIAGKGSPAFRRDDGRRSALAKCFGFVQTYDENHAAVCGS